MNKNHVIRELSAYIDGELTASEKNRIEEHLKTCGSCARELARLIAVSEKVRAWQVSEPGPFFDQAIKEKITSEGNERGVVKMKSKKLVTLIPGGVLAGILAFAVVGYLIKEGVYQPVLQTRTSQIVTAQSAHPVTFSKRAEKAKTYFDEAKKAVKGERAYGGVIDRSAPIDYEYDNASYLGTNEAASLGPVSAQTGGKVYLANDSYNGACEATRATPASMAYNKTCVVQAWTQVTHYSAYPQEYNTEQYDKIAENGFLKATDNPLSTFSIDVDTASFANVRRFLNQNTMPPKDAVRIEELVNYFSYDYPKPQPGSPFSVTTEMGPCPWNTKHSLVLVGLRGDDMNAKTAPASNLVFLLDISGSMADANKLPLIKSAFRILVDKLRPQDRVSVVVYSSTSRVVLDSVSGRDKAKILNAIDSLNADGATAGWDGIQLAYKIAKQDLMRNGNNRVILATDGDFNVGPSNDTLLTQMIEEKRKDGIFLTVLGFGMGNYKDAKLEKIADKGNGSIHYIDNLLEAKKVFVTDLMGTIYTIAKDVKIQVEFNPTQVKAYRLIGYENRILNKEDFNDDKKDAGELGAGHTVTALYEVVPASSDEDFGKVDSLRYQKTIAAPNNELLTVKLRYKEPKSDVSKLIVERLLVDRERTGNSDNLNFASAVTEFGMLLRDSQYKANASYQDVIMRAKASKGADESGYRAEFIKLAEMAELLDTKNKKK